MRQRYRMIGNQKGVTLFELLAAATLATLCFIIIMSLWISSENSASRTLSENGLQQDAQLVRTKIENAYHNRKRAPFSLVVENGKVELDYTESGTEELVSGDGYYRVIKNDGSLLDTYTWNEFRPTSLNAQPINLNVSAEDGDSPNGLQYVLNVTLEDIIDDSSQSSSD